MQLISIYRGKITIFSTLSEHMPPRFRAVCVLGRSGPRSVLHHSGDETCVSWTLGFQCPACLFLCIPCIDLVVRWGSVVQWGSSAGILWQLAINRILLSTKEGVSAYRWLSKVFASQYLPAENFLKSVRSGVARNTSMFEGLGSCFSVFFQMMLGG